MENVFHELWIFMCILGTYTLYVIWQLLLQVDGLTENPTVCFLVGKTFCCALLVSHLKMLQSSRQTPSLSHKMLRMLCDMSNHFFGSLYFPITKYDLYILGKGWNELVIYVLETVSFLEFSKAFESQWFRCLESADRLLQYWMLLSSMTTEMLSVL